MEIKPRMSGQKATLIRTVLTEGPATLAEIRCELGIQRIASVLCQLCDRGQVERAGEVDGQLLYALTPKGRERQSWVNWRESLTAEQWANRTRKRACERKAKRRALNYKPPNTNTRKIHARLLDDGPTTASELAEELGISVKAVHQALGRLRTRGIIDIVGACRGKRPTYIYGVTQAEAVA